MTEAETRQAMALLMPEKIDVMPFTRIESFDDDDRPDGVAVFLRPINVLGDPVNIVGNVRVELYEYVPASGLREGALLYGWDIALANKQDQLRYWSSTTQMYEFRLALNTEKLPPRPKYVLAVTYNTPLGAHMSDEYILDVPLARESFAGTE
jgi:hypothetical protein